MGLFDFFKKKNQNRETDEPVKPEMSAHATTEATPHAINHSSQDPHINTNHFIDDIADGNEEDFNLIIKYAEYVVCFLGMMFQDTNAPIAAYEKPDGELIGYVFVGGDDGYSLTATQVVERMGAEFVKRINAGQIKSWTILYHSEFKKDGNHCVASDSSTMNAITVRYELNGKVKHLAIPYTINGDEVIYKGFSGFSQRQNYAILSNQLVDDKNYFQELVEMKAEIHTNEVGLQIKKVNNGSLGNLWGGILGFERLATSGNLMMEYMALTFMDNYLKHATPEVFVYELLYGDVIFRAVKTSDDSRRTVMPHVKAIKAIDVVNKQISEWENSDNLEAVISGIGRDTFGVTYFATDYAANKHLYQSRPQLNILFSAILFVLAEAETNEKNESQDVVFSDAFAGYIPHKELAEFGCFEFTGVVENFYKNNVLEQDRAKGYIVNIRLINNSEVEDFFTIPMFINTENMRFAELCTGMKVSGVFQLLGEIQK